ncbi:hypothetical protein SADUNF_Sadunf01G0064900 [Salix dunnii]|uniref:Uncharacterized protein n=1 Tax=Salix dunnii TaxID=1413687 RepID=A0A835NAE5_9ROSI|nr:hypothetical protein SADUNF_Sadunf01G0064900 [Salix dunnii]
MRSQYIPEARSTIMNFFRIPLIISVCIVLYNKRLKLIAKSQNRAQKWTATKEMDTEPEPLNI